MGAAADHEAGTVHLTKSAREVHKKKGKETGKEGLKKKKQIS